MSEYVELGPGWVVEVLGPEQPTEIQPEPPYIERQSFETSSTGIIFEQPIVVRSRPDPGYEGQPAPDRQGRVLAAILAAASLAAILFIGART